MLSNQFSVVTSDGRARSATSASLSPGASADSASRFEIMFESRNPSAANARRVGSVDSATVRSAERVRIVINHKFY